MIDLFTIFHRGGATLFTRQLNEVPHQPVDALIQNVLLEERIGTTSYRHEDKYIIKWQLANECDLVFVAVYLNFTNLLYIDALLADCREKFVELFRDAIKAGDIEPSAVYAKKFNRIYDDIVRRHESGSGLGVNNAAALTTAETITKKPQHTLSKKKKDETNEQDGESTAGDASDSKPANTTDDESTDASSSATPAVNLSKLAALQNAARTGKPVHAFGAKKKKPSSESTPASDEKPAGKPKKVIRARNEDKLTKADLSKQLDYRHVIEGSEVVEDESSSSGFEGEKKQPASYSAEMKLEYSDDEDEGDESDDEAEDGSSSSSSSSSAPKKSSGGFFSFMKTLVSGKVLERSDLEPVLQVMKDQLNGKNVAAEISEQLAESVIKTLEGQKLASFTSVKSMVKRAMEEALTRILTPNRQIDVLAGVVEANEQKRPYSIVFVGVNGVGKSTSLAKTASYFLTKGLTVGVGACDTFRAGAIEQLRTHTKALKIPLYARGYDRDAATVAQDAIMQARQDSLNVVLIDTAGRMQHNEPLMRALAKLITLNKPDLVLFVGEALVGNDAVDQVREFNRSLSDMSDEKKPRLIDAIILTKFDTIDDRVGAAISMAYVTGQPILFVGTGQTYADLKRMNVKTLIRSLLR